MIKTIFLCQHSHSDPGYTDLAWRIKQLHVNNTKLALDYCEKKSTDSMDERFKWTIESSWVVEEFFKQSNLENKRRFIKYWKNGNLEVTAFYLGIISHHPDLEELKESVRYSTELGKEVDCPVETATLNDVGTATWALPEVLTNSGIKYFVLGAGGFRVLLPWENLPHLFHWQGPGKEKVLLWHIGLDRNLPPSKMKDLRAQYGLGKLMILSIRKERLKEKSPANEYDEVMRNDDISWATLENLQKRLLSEKYPFEEILLQCACDNSGPDPEVVDDVVFWNRTGKTPKIVISTMKDFFHFMENKYKGKIPVLRGDITCTWLDQSGSLPLETALHRRAGHTLSLSNSLLKEIKTDKEEFRKRIQNTYKQMLWYSDHTYGLSAWGIEKPLLATGSIYDSVFSRHKSSWDCKAGYARKSHDMAQDIFADILNIAESKLIDQKADFAVFNPSEFDRCDVVDLMHEGSDCFNYNIEDLKTGKSYPADAQAMSGRWVRLTFVPTKIKGGALGHFKILKTTPRNIINPDINKVENEFYRIIQDPKTGWIKSIVDLLSQRELRDSRSDHLFGEVLRSQVKGIRHDVFFAGINSPVKREFAKQASFACHPATLGNFRKTLRSSHILTGEMEATRVYLEVNLFKGIRKIEFIITIEKRPTSLREDLRVAFPFAIKAPAVFYRLAGCTAKMGRDQLPGSHTDYLPVHDWVNISDSNFNITFCPLDAPLVEIGGIRAESWEGIKYRPRTGRIYSYAANNIYQTNIPQWNGGNFVLRYVFDSQAKPFSETQALKFGEAAHMPFIPLKRNIF